MQQFSSEGYVRKWGTKVGRYVPSSILGLSRGLYSLKVFSDLKWQYGACSRGTYQRR